MLTSATALVMGMFKHYVSLIGGTLVAVIGFVADALGFDVPAGVWAVLATAFVAWAIIAAYHDLRIQCGAAIDGLRDKMDHQALADALTGKYAYAKGHFFNVGDIQMLRQPWLDSV
jgi:hypothetical protein